TQRGHTVIGEAGWAVVDVETSGLSPYRDRVLSLSIICLDPAGNEQHQFYSLFNPGVDPGAVHIHGLSKAKLKNQAPIENKIAHISDLLKGRIVIAHNAAFDTGFLAAEFSRFSMVQPFDHRLCTIAFSKKLDLDLSNYQLPTVANYWKIRQVKHHDAQDDARVTAEIFKHSWMHAWQLGISLPVVPCSSGSKAFPGKTPSINSNWKNPGKWKKGQNFVQGMSAVITGETEEPRPKIIEKLTAAGLSYANSVSKRTSVLVSNNAVVDTSKIRRAKVEGVEVISEAEFLSLIPHTQSGFEFPSQISTGADSQLPAPKVKQAGIWSRYRVLVLGGDHSSGVKIRDILSENGARPALVFNASVTHLVVLPGGESDARVARARDRGVPVMSQAEFFQTVSHKNSADSSVDLSRICTHLKRGQVVDLDTLITKFAVSVSWGADLKQAEIDLVAFELNDSEKVTADDDFVFYNQPVSGSGVCALVISSDTQQELNIDLERIEEDITRITIAISLSEGSTFGDLGPIDLEVSNVDGTIFTSTLDAGSVEQSMILAEIYRRGEIWRFRAVGQGYECDLGSLATRYGVKVGES
ncbi:MAG: TerD family protein, partial [Mycobacteriaceae bacterium]